MSKQPILVIMAAGMGSRFGGLKQIEPVGPCGEIIPDYSIYHAKKAGFNRVVFIIKEEHYELFREVAGKLAEKIMDDVKYVFQDINNIPESFSVPDGRKKPWGTGHAVLAARDVLDAPFAVINADDYYGEDAYVQIYNYLTSTDCDGLREYATVAFELGKTVSEYGSVARGICKTDESGYLVNVTETTEIYSKQGRIYSVVDGAEYNLDANTPVAMNFWGFGQGFVDELEIGFVRFLNKHEGDLLKCEYYLTTLIDELMKMDRCKVRTLSTTDKWYGITYKEDMPVICAAMKAL